MTAPAPSGGPSPLRVGAFALLGLGVVAGIIGLATFVGGDGPGDPTATPTPTSAIPAPGAPAPGTEPTDGAVPGDGVVPDDVIPDDGVPGDGAAPTDGSVPLPTFDGAAPPPPSDGTPPGGAAAPAPAPGVSGTGGGGSGTGTSGTGDGARAGSASDAGAAARSEAALRMPLRVYNNSTIENLAAEGAADFEAAGWTVTEISGYPYGIIPTSTVYYRPGTDEQAAAEVLAAEFGLRSKPRFAGIEDASPGLIVILTSDYQHR